MSGQAPLHILLTGFGPFEGAPVNPTGRLIEHLLAYPPALPAPARLTTAIFPVAYGPMQARLTDLLPDVDIALHLGLAASARHVRLERLARNVLSARPDMDAHCPTDTCIASGAPDLPVRLPLPAICRALTVAGIPTETSDDAGTYLCNYLFYLSASGMTGHTPPLCGFIHLPHLPQTVQTPDQASLPLETQAQAIAIILETTMRQMSAPTAPRSVAHRR